MTDNLKNIVDREDPLAIFQFGLELDGTLSGFFTECNGIGSEHDVVEMQHVDGSGHSFIMKLPGIIKYQDVTLKRGITSNMDIWQWRADAESGDMKAARKNASIIAFNRSFEEVARWNFYNAWPSKVSGPDFNSGSSDFGLEEVVLVHEGFHREK